MWIPDLSKYQGPKYIAIAEALCDDIQSGRLKPGEKLPAQRELSYALQVNFGTVTKAYSLASDRGMVRGEIGRGTFVRKAAPSTETPWPRETVQVGRIDMRSDFPCSLADDPVFKETFQELGQHAHFEALFQYQPGSARSDHLESAQAWLKSMCRIEAMENRIIITNGALHGGFLSLMAISKPGDLILTEETTSPAVRSIAAMLHLRLKSIDTDDQGAVPEHLEALLNQETCTGIYLIPNFHNPTTSILPVERRQKIARLAEHFGIYVIEDDVFGCLMQQKTVPISAMIPEHSFYITSFSKAIAPGFRVGYVVPPDHFYQTLLTNLKVTSWMASPVMGEAISQWINNGTARRLVSLQIKRVSQRVTFITDKLNNFSIRSHSGCPHMWLDLPGSIRESEAVMALNQEGIDVTQGEYFSVRKGDFPGGLRLCVGQVNDPAQWEYICDVIRKVLSDPFA